MTTNTLTIPIGTQLLRIATIIAIPNGAKSWFSPKLTKDSKKETTYKDVVTSKVYSTKEDNVLLHKIYSSEGVELAVLQSTWDAR